MAKLRGVEGRLEDWRKIRSMRGFAPEAVLVVAHFAVYGCGSIAISRPEKNNVKSVFVLTHLR